MSWIVWREEYHVGDETIDRDHQALFKLINEFYAAFQESKSRRELQNILNELVAYAERHFEREELIMAAYGYPALEEHHQLHEKLYGTIYVLNEHLEKDPRPLENEAIAFLKNWLTDHILLHDLAFGEFINKRK